MTDSNSISKSDILSWVNTFFKVNLPKLEEACTGAIYCQIFESIYKGAINMSKVNWKASLEHEYYSNFKMLQQAFAKMNVKKEFNIERLIKGKPQETLEFFQFLKNHFDMNFKEKDSYDPESRRNYQTLSCKSKSVSQEKTNIRKQGNSKPPSEKINISSIHSIKEESYQDKENSMLPIKSKEKLSSKIMSEIEKERDFYFSKLNDIQFILDNSQREIYPELFELIETALISKTEIKVIKDDSGNLSVKPLSECK